MNKSLLTIILLLIDILLIFFIFVPSLIVKLGIKPFQRGFYCDDESISYPYRHDTVSVITLTSIGIILPIITIVIVEIAYFYQFKKFKSIYDLSPFVLYNFQIHSIIANITCAVSNFLAGLAFCLGITETGKIIVGRLRPHFFSACNIKWDTVNCYEDIATANGLFRRMNYVQNFTCIQTDPYMLLNSRKSFPSGHSSSAIYFAFFVVFYVQYRIHWNRLLFLKMFYQTTLIVLASYVCLSRISDYKHHWSDVLGGVIIGFTIAYYTTVINWQIQNDYKKCEKNIMAEKRIKKCQHDAHGDNINRALGENPHSMGLQIQ